jgi:hypothetical protein
MPNVRTRAKIERFQMIRSVSSIPSVALKKCHARAEKEKLRQRGWGIQRMRRKPILELVGKIGEPELVAKNDQIVNIRV